MFYMKNLFSAFLFVAVCFFNFTANASNYEEERQVFELINQERAAHGVAPLHWSRNSNLQRAAEIRAKEIASFFSHQRSDGSDYLTVVNQCGVRYSACGENIAMGMNLAGRFVVARWMHSQDHSAIILNSEFKETGIASFRVDLDVYWVQLFVG